MTSDTALDLTTAENQSAPEDPGPEAPQPKKGKKKSKNSGELGSAKAIETMFRTSIQTELEIIALAATKANIMISLNGFIISALMISGAFLFNSSPSFLIPAAVFILTSAGSITFALLAASPERAGSVAALRDWFLAYRRKEAGLRDIRGYVLRGHRRTESDEEMNLLIYEDRVQVAHEDYWDRMQMLLRDHDQIYRRMSDQLYWLGQMANRKFKLLNFSYAIFRWGLLASIVVFLALKTTFWAFPSLSGSQPSAVPNMGISEFTDVYEPSAVQQLPDGRILVVEDEASRAVNILTVGSNGQLEEDNATDLKVTRGFGRNLSDLEGLSIDDQEFVYAITSHSPNADGERNGDREQLLRFQIKGSQVGSISTYTTLRDDLIAADGLHDAVEKAAGEKVSFDELNIEGMTYHRATKQLLLGLRDPMAGNHSIIVPIQNPSDVFEGKAAPVFADPIMLDLQGGGIRALSYDAVLGSFLIVNEIEGEDGKTSQLWSWDGNAGSAPQTIALPGMINLNNVESIDSITIEGEHRLLIMSDEGDPKKNRPAKYLMLSYDQLPEPEPSPSSEPSPSGTS